MIILINWIILFGAQPPHVSEESVEDFAVTSESKFYDAFGKNLRLKLGVHEDAASSPNSIASSRPNQLTNKLR
jgi:hypothetical protein